MCAGSIATSTPPARLRESLGGYADAPPAGILALRLVSSFDIGILEVARTYAKY